MLSTLTARDWTAVVPQRLSPMPSPPRSNNVTVVSLVRPSSSCEPDMKAFSGPL